MFNPLPVIEEQGHFFRYFWLFLSLSPSISPSVSHPLICFFSTNTHTSSEVYFCLWLIVSSSLSPRLSPLSSVSSSQSLCLLSHSSAAVHVRGNNGSCECAWNNTAGELLLLNAQRTHTPLSLQSYWHSSNASLSHFLTPSNALSPSLSLSLSHPL